MSVEGNSVLHASIAVLIALCLCIDRTSATINQEVTPNPNEAHVPMLINDLGEPNIQNVSFVCRCYWTKHKHIGFKAILGIYSPHENHPDCSLSRFGMDDVQSAQWNCHIDVVQPRIKLYQNESSPEKELPQEENINRFITHATQSANISITSKVKLSCEFSAHAPWCYWTKDGDVVAIEGRYAFIGDKNNGDCSISISNASMVDDGSWICHYPKTSHQDKIKSEPCTLKVLVEHTAPVIVMNGVALKKDQKIYIKAPSGTNYGYGYNHYSFPADISCWSLNGNPVAKLKWKTPANSNINQHSTSTVTSSKYPKLYNIRMDLRSTQVTSTWQQTNLTCYAEKNDNEHFDENQAGHTTVQLVFSFN